MTKRRDVLKGIGGGAAVMAMGGVVAADDDTDDQGDGTTAEVRVGHLSPDTPDVDVYVLPPGENPTDVGKDNANVQDLSYGNFAPGADGGYLDIESGTYDISVTPADSPETEPIDIDDFELEANKNYTILAIGEFTPEGGEPGLQALPLVDNADDDTALPPADATLVRFVHASPDAGSVDIEVGGDTLLSGVTFGTASGYNEAPPDVNVEVFADADGDGDIDDSALGPVTNPFSDGEKGTVYVIGNAASEDGDGPLPGGAVGGNVGEIGALTTLDATNPGKGRGDDDRDDDGDDDDDDDEGDGDRGRGDDNGRGRGND